MNKLSPEQIKSKILEDTWTRWLERPFGTLITSYSEKALTKEYMRKIGLDFELESCLFEKGAWYTPEKAMHKCAENLWAWLESGHKLTEITEKCEEFYKEKKKRIKELCKSKEDLKDKLIELDEIFNLSFTYIWITHPLEEAFTERLRKEASKYVKSDVDKFMGDISVPEKKNAHALMEEAIINGVSPEKIAEEYGWIKARSNLAADGFTAGDIEELRNKIKENKEEQKTANPNVPKGLIQLVKQVKELVWFRTYRTDVFYELFYLSRPIFNETAKKYKLELKDLKDYRMCDLISGNLNKYQSNFTLAVYKGNFAYFDKPILPEEIISDKTLKGVVAFKGRIQGRVKIVNSVNDVPKVQEGDILVATMTFPSYIMAMKKASAFVTNEGGITCHASIVAREMKKPCIVGTKTATKVLKNGMMIEVDADKGIVNILKEKK
jgi:phosphohistidine swiveling domain-containing protein